MHFWILLCNDRRHRFFNLLYRSSGHLLWSRIIFFYDLPRRKIPAEFRLGLVHKLSRRLFLSDPIHLYDCLYIGAVRGSRIIKLFEMCGRVLREQHRLLKLHFLRHGHFRTVWY